MVPFEILITPWRLFWINLIKAIQLLHVPYISHCSFYFPRSVLHRHRMLGTRWNWRKFLRFRIWSLLYFYRLTTRWRETIWQGDIPFSGLWEESECEQHLLLQHGQRHIALWDLRVSDKRPDMSDQAGLWWLCHRWPSHNHSGDKEHKLLRRHIHCVVPGQELGLDHLWDQLRPAHDTGGAVWLQ